MTAYIASQSQIKIILCFLFCLLSIFVPLKVEAKVEIIGAKDLKILLPKDYGPKEAYRLTLPLMNTSDKGQQVCYELSGFKTKENIPMTVTLYEAEGHNPSLVYNGGRVRQTSDSTERGY